MPLTPRDKHEIGKAHGKLVDRLHDLLQEAAKEWRLYLKTADCKHVNRWAELKWEIASLLQRIERAERLMEGPE